MTPPITHTWRPCDVVGCWRLTFVHDSCKRCRYRIPRRVGKPPPTTCARCRKVGRWKRPECCSWCVAHPLRMNVCASCKGGCRAPATMCYECRVAGCIETVTEIAAAAE